MLAGIGQTKNTPDDLLHVNFGGAVGECRQNIGERTIPALFQRVDSDDIANRAGRRKQPDVFQLVDLGGFDGDLLLRHADFNQFISELLKRRGTVLAFGLSLKKNDRANV